MTSAEPTSARSAASPNPSIPPVLVVEDLRVHYETTKGAAKAVDGVSFALKPGERLGLIGEAHPELRADCVARLSAS